MDRVEVKWTRLLDVGSNSWSMCCSASDLLVNNEASVR